MRVTRFGQGHPHDMAVEIKVVVFDEDRPGHVEGGTYHSLGQDGNFVDAIGDNGLDLFEANGRVLLARFQFDHGADVHRRAGIFEQDERAVQRIKKFGHRPELPNPPSPRVASGSSSTTTKALWPTAITTSWAMRSPLATS